MDNYTQHEFLSEKELFIIIGEHSLDGHLMSTPPTDDDHEEAGRRMFAEVLPIIQQKLCLEGKPIELITDPDDVRTLALVIADIVAAVVVGIPAITVSWLIIKIGITRICMHEQIL